MTTEAEDQSWGTLVLGRSTVEGSTAKNPPGESSTRGGLAVGDGYELLGELGRGGMGVVFKARQVRLNRLVALKMLRDGHADGVNLQRFRNEAELVARLRHANVVQIFEVGERNGSPFVAFEFLEGGTLAERLAARPLSGREAGELLVRLSRAMDAAHREGVIHRDLKPSNILFSHDGVPKIADFGLAKRLEADDGNTRTGEVMGTPSYMAPEQARGDVREIGPATDVYSLGAILYETLTGRPPFKGPTSIETVRLVTEAEPVAPSKLQPNVPRDLETICLKCLEKDPRRRYLSASDLADDLDRYLAGLPVRARRTPAWERAAKWGRRHPTYATLMALGLAAVAVGARAWVNSAEQARQNRDAYETMIGQIQRTVGKQLAEARVDLAQKHWGDARVKITGELMRLASDEVLKGGDERISELRSAAAGLLKEAQEGQDLEKKRADRAAAITEYRGRYQDFSKLRDRALYHVTGLTGLGPEQNRRELRNQAAAALAVFAPADPAGGPLKDIPEGLTPQEIDELRERNYELSLILAGAAESPEEGLAALDRAARLGSTSTKAYHLNRATCLDRLGDRASAERERAEAASVEPSSAFDQFLTGLDRYRAGDFAVAARRFDAAYRIQPDYFWAQCLSALCDLRQGRASEAKVGLSACLTQRPDLAVLHVLRAFASCTLAERDPKGGADAQLSDAEADFGKAEELLRKDPDEVLQYAFLVNRGTMWYLRERWDDAVTDLGEAIRRHPDRVEAYPTLAQVYQKKGDTGRAIETFTKALATRPRDAALYRARAQVVVDLKAAATPEQRRAALADLNQAIGLEPARSPVLAIDRTNLARLLDRDGRPEEALAACDAALELAPARADRQRLETRLVKLAILSRLNRYQDVIRSCDEALATGLPSPKLLELRGLARSFLKDYAGAVSDLSQALPAVAPEERPRLLTRRGELYLVSDATRLALHDFEEALRLEPALVEAHAGRGLALARLGQVDPATAEAESAVRLGDPNASLPPYLAARVYMQAASAVLDPPRRRGALEDTVRFQDRATLLLNLSILRQPPHERAAFLRDKIQKDPLFRRLARSRAVGGPASP